MAGGNTKYTDVVICTTTDMTKCFAVAVTASGQEHHIDLGVVHHVTASDAVLAEYWTPSRLKTLPAERCYSDAVFIDGQLVFVCALERLVFASEFIQRQGGADPFAELPLGEALETLRLASDSGLIHLPTLEGLDIFGRCYSIG